MAQQVEARSENAGLVGAGKVMGLYEVEKLIAKVLADGQPRYPAEVIQKAETEGARPLVLVKEALWSLIGAGVIEITENYQLVRVK